MVVDEGPLEWLRASGAQRDVLDGLRALVEATPLGQSRWAALWNGCPRGDWLLGIAARLGVDHRALVRAASGCARTTLDLVEDPAAAHVLATADAWTEGRTDAAAVRAATDRLEAESATSPAEDAAMRAALAVGMGVDDRDVVAGAAACAAEARILATLDCGMEVVVSYAHRRCADAVRAAIPWSMVEARLPAPGGPT